MKHAQKWIRIGEYLLIVIIALLRVRMLGILLIIPLVLIISLELL